MANNETVASVLASINALAASGAIDKNAARAAGLALGFTGNDAMLAVRLLADGSDPASIEYLGTGTVSEPIALAHARGPGSLTGEDRDRWLNLASVSHDESKGSTLRDRVNGFILADATLRGDLTDSGAREARIEAKRAEVAGLAFTLETIGGREMRVYSTDLGFAAAYWDGEPCAAVRGTGIMFCASSGTPLADLGVTIPEVGQRGPCFSVLSEDGTRGLPRA
jgi:hypothetical protein